METMTGDGETGSQAKWHVLPARIEPQDWATAQDTEPVPGSVQSAAEQTFSRDLRRVPEWGATG